MVRWLFKLSFAEARREWGLVFAAGAGYLIGSLGIVMLVFAFIEFLSRAEPVVLVGIAINPSSTIMFATAAFGVAGVISLTAAFQYLSRSRAIRIGRYAQERLTTSAITRSAELPDACDPQGSALMAEGRIFEATSTGARYGGMAARLLGYAVPAVVTVPFAVVVLLVMAPSLTLLLGALGLCTLAAQYSANRMAVFAGEAWRKHRFGANARLRALLSRLNAQPRSCTDLTEVAHAAAGLSDDYAVRSMNDAFEGRLRAVEVGALHFQVGGALIIAVALIFIAREVVSGTPDVAFLAAYIALLRVLLSNVALLGRVTTSIGRLLGPIADLYRFLNAKQLLASGSPREISRSANLNLTLVVTPLAGDDPRIISLSPGDRIALLVQPGYGRDVAATVAQMLSSSDRRALSVDLAAPVIRREVLLGDTAPEVADMNWSEIARESLTANLADAYLLDEDQVHVLDTIERTRAIVFVCYRAARPTIGAYGERVVTVAARGDLLYATWLPKEGLDEEIIWRLQKAIKRAARTSTNDVDGGDLD